MRTDAASPFVQIAGVEFLEVPDSVLASLRETLAAALPLNSIVDIQARTAIVLPDGYAQVVAIATTSGYASYPTFLPKVLGARGSREEPAAGINAFIDSSGLRHLLWLDGQVVVDVASLDAKVGAGLAAAIHDGTGPLQPPRSLLPSSAMAKLLPVRGYRYAPVPLEQRDGYLRWAKPEDQATADAIEDSALVQVLPVDAGGDQAPLAVILSIAFDPEFVAWSLAGAGRLLLDVGEAGTSIPIPVEPTSPRLATTSDGRTVISWLAGSVAILIAAGSLSSAAPILNAYHAPGFEDLARGSGGGAS